MARKFVTVETLSVGIDVGATMTLKVPANKNDAGTGAFPYKNDQVRFGGYTFNTLDTYGFAMTDASAGKLTFTNNNCLEVSYTHLKPINNSVYFFAADGRVSAVHIIRTPVHTHSSIFQGGPAYGTYFSEADLQGAS